MLDLSEYELFEIIDGAREGMGHLSYEGMDPVYSVMEHILQMARSHIEGITGYDFLNDFSGSTEIYTYGNYMCSSYDYSDEAIGELRDKVFSHLEALNQNKWCRYFLGELEIRG